MSTFKGTMEEFKNVSIDRFDEENLNSTVYLLSHVHSDHMQGLAEPELIDHLQKCDYKIYCSDITKILLLGNDNYRHLESQVETLPVDSPQLITVPEANEKKIEFVTITLIPAGHCLGSTMFLLEGASKTALYTGDFRIPPAGVTRIRHLHSGESVKRLDSLYIDTTFCIPRARYIATREQSADAVTDLVYGWVYQSPLHLVQLISGASYSYEHLYEILHRKFDIQVHVEDRFYKNYVKIPGLAGHLTVDGSSTQIHACGHARCAGLQRKDVKILKIQLSTLWFSQSERLLKDMVVKLGTKTRVCYCFHPSYTEIKEWVSYLRPDRVYPNVKPPFATLEETQALLDSFLYNDQNVEPSLVTDRVSGVGTEIAREQCDRLTTRKRKPSVDISEGFDFGDADDSCLAPPL